MRKNLLLVGVFCVLAACERTSLSPVEIKIDQDIGGFATTENINNTYTVKKGETLFDVANRFNIDPMNLAKLNGISAPYNVKGGQVLKLPIEEVSTDSSSRNPFMPIEEEKKSNELDEKFNALMSHSSEKSGKNNSVNSSNKKSDGFNEQAALLASPKITKTATGANVESNKSSSQSSKNVSAEKSAKSSDKDVASNSKKIEDASKTLSSKKMVRPTEGKIISKFGDSLDGLPNDGINIKAPEGTPVKSVSDGEVLYAGNKLDDSFGNVVVVKHNDGLISSYANLQNISVEQGAKLKAGQKLGTVGNTGSVKEPQLHFEIMKDNNPVNPSNYLKL